MALELTDETFLRGPDPNGYNPIQITRQEVPACMTEGMLVMATQDDRGRALLLRPAMGE